MHAESRSNPAESSDPDRELIRAARRDFETAKSRSVQLPEVVGGYKILGRLREGGMGIVYRARQEHPSRIVALKVIRPELLDEERLRRFEFEAECLGRLNHPGVAQIYEWGIESAVDGRRPFLVMELIAEGTPITRHAAEHGLDLPERLALFLDVCAAVQHAHNQRIIHRDLKPSNVLVTVQDGRVVPKVIDFGIATSAEGEDPDTKPLGALCYMSPEQIDPQQAVDTRTDVYSLGVLLYELLTEVLPFDPHELDRIEIRRQIQLVAPSPASGRVSAPDNAVGTVPYELDAIVLKALCKDPEERYATPSELAQDVRRTFEHQPVLALPPARYYRVRKFLRREWRSVVAVSTLAFVLLLGGIVSGVNWHRAEDALDAAERSAKSETEARVEAERANSVALFRAARLADQRGLWNEALAYYESALRLGYPDEATIRLGQIDALEGSLRVDESLAVLATLARAECSPEVAAKVTLLRGSLDANRFVDPDAGLDLIRAALASEKLSPPDAAYARALLADTVEEALKHARHAHQLDAYHRRANDLLGPLLVTSGRHEEAIQFARVLQGISPADPSPILFEAMCLALRGEGDLASDLLRRKSRLLPKSTAGLADALIGLDRFVTIACELIREPLHGSGSSSFGTTAKLLKAIPALNRFLKGLSAFDELNRIRLRLPPVLFKAWRPVIAFVQQELGLDPTSPISLLMGLSRLTKGGGKDVDSEAAGRVLTEAIRRHPDGTLFILRGGFRLLDATDSARANERNRHLHAAAADFRTAITSGSMLPQLRGSADVMLLTVLIDLYDAYQRTDREKARAVRIEAMSIIRTLLRDTSPQKPLSPPLALLFDAPELAFEIANHWRRLDPSDVDAMAHQAGSCYQLGAYGLAVRFADEALAIKPRHALAAKIRRSALSNLGKIGPPGREVLKADYLQRRGNR